MKAQGDVVAGAQATQGIQRNTHGAQTDTTALYAYQSAPAASGTTSYLPNTGAGENTALIAGSAALAGLGTLLMPARRRFRLER